MSFIDMFKNSVVEQFTAGATLGDMLMSLGVAFLMGAFILAIYRLTFRGVMFSKGFAYSLVLLAMVTALVIRTISSNLALSLGMVGALSIVRYRTAVKDPLDVGFLFWTVAVGVTCGAGLYLISLMGTVAIALVYILLVKIRSHRHLYLLIVKYADEATDTVLRELEPIKKVLKNKTATKGYTELTYEVRLSGDNTSFTNRLSACPGVESAVIVEFTGDYFE